MNGCTCRIIRIGFGSFGNTNVYGEPNFAKVLCPLCADIRATSELLAKWDKERANQSTFNKLTDSLTSVKLSICEKVKSWFIHPKNCS